MNTIHILSFVAGAVISAASFFFTSYAMKRFCNNKRQVMLVFTVKWPLLILIIVGALKIGLAPISFMAGFGLATIASSVAMMKGKKREADPAVNR